MKLYDYTCAECRLGIITLDGGSAVGTPCASSRFPYPTMMASETASPFAKYTTGRSTAVCSRSTTAISYSFQVPLMRRGLPDSCYVI